ncbi:hypothetical protein [Sphaerimonospora mesophila]|uniref:hypothetical protein n=1 Tax=Sphaerimonospora mesophila TaxID=37483 RepID=UPI0006E35219
MNSLLPLSRRQRSVSDHPGSRRHRRAARAVTCALLLSLATAVSSTQPAAAAPGSADPAAGSVTPAVTYVQMFGRCG